MLDLLKIYQQMGFAYCCFRFWYEFQKKSGLLKFRFSYKSPSITIPSLADWQKEKTAFFFNSKSALRVKKRSDTGLKNRVERYLNTQELRYFHNPYLFLRNTDWHTNPTNGYKYPQKHWTSINDFREQAGDIKFVWEKARFSFLQDLIRYDYHFQKDCYSTIFAEITSWINENPVNIGVHYYCGQEIAMRVLNWIFALYYYSERIEEVIFHRIVQSIYEQTQRIADNHRFAQNAVQNNHVLSEALAIYVVGLLFPFMPQANAWKEKGRKSIENCVEKHFFDDGSYIQYSHNYQRLAIQLLGYAMRLADIHQEPFSLLAHSRLQNSVAFLQACQDPLTGKLPNYGANDGTLFLSLNQQDYRDFRPNLLTWLKYGAYTCSFDLEEFQEESEWIGIEKEPSKIIPVQKINSFKRGGYYTLYDGASLTFIRCGNHDFRPSQADNLHIDIWVNGGNILRDAGSYSYNCSPQEQTFFFGTASHNTLMLGKYDQMQKAKRFVWFDWTQCQYAHWQENDEKYIFEGEISAFTYLDKNIRHHRKIIKTKTKKEWLIEDTMKQRTKLPITQIWNICDDFLQNFEIVAKSGNKLLEMKIRHTWVSDYYGNKKTSQQIYFESDSPNIQTLISKK